MAPESLPHAQGILEKLQQDFPSWAQVKVQELFRNRDPQPVRTQEAKKRVTISLLKVLTERCQGRPAVACNSCRHVRQQVQNAALNRRFHQALRAPL